ncbi:MAG: FAD:protein FMN transferase [Flavobacteriaceae bacterium]|nr:FAD:protein FMN transferase [Flavobacteriaceae bacterium]
MKHTIWFLFLILMISCKKERPHKSFFQGQAFGTTFSIQVYSINEIEFEKGIDSVLSKVNNSVSTYIPESDISKINNGNTAIIVDDIFIDNFNISAEVYENTGGFFDPTIGVLRNAYGFGDTNSIEEIDSLALDSMMKFVGFNKVKLTSENKIEKLYPEIYIDFNAVAKGYGIDLIGSYLDSKGVNNYLIELGGEILAKGKNVEKNKSWLVGIENVNLNDKSFSNIIALEDIAMATSGNYRKFRIDSLTGKKYVHTLNPITGSASKSDITSATVLASTCALADAYATAFMALGLENSKVILKNIDKIDVYFTYNDQNNEEQVFATEGLIKRLVN